jgi:hypothetical protein
MSAERDLLRRAKCLLECSNMEPLQRQADCIIGEIKELLEQPEQEPVVTTKQFMSNVNIVSATPAHYNDQERNAFKVGVKWYEKYFALIGWDGNE